MCFMILEIGNGKPRLHSLLALAQHGEDTYLVKLCISVDEPEPDIALIGSMLSRVLDVLLPLFSESFTRSDSAAMSSRIEFSETFQV